MKIVFELFRVLVTSVLMALLGTALCLSTIHTIHEAPKMKQQIRHLESRVLELEDGYDKGEDDEPS